MNEEITIPELDINEMSRQEIESVPCRGEYDTDIGEFDSLIILPQEELHESGFRLMDFVACIKRKPICRLSGCSDVLHINGIGGCGIWKGSIPSLVPPVGWRIDCLAKSGLLRLFTDYNTTMKARSALSSFEVYAIKKS